MKWLNKIFKKDRIQEEEDIEEIKEEVSIPTGETCDACNLPIFGEQKSVHKTGKVYHVKPCWRNLQKMAKKQAFG